MKFLLPIKIKSLRVLIVKTKMSDKEACSRIEKRSVIKFLVAERCKAVEIHRRMSIVYGATYFIKNKHKERGGQT